MPYCTCETPVMGVEYDAGCRRCGLPVYFTPGPSQLEELAAELVSLALFAERAPTERGRARALEQARTFVQRLNHSGWPNAADEIDRARLGVERNQGTWAGLGTALSNTARALRAYAQSVTLA